MNVYFKPYRFKPRGSSELDHVAATVARWFIGGFFVYSAVDNLLNPIITAERLDIPGALLLVTLGAIIKLILGVCIMLRYHTKYASMLLAVYLTTVTTLFYGPWLWAGSELSQVIFSRNLAILGGLLFVFAYSRGSDLWTEQFRTESETRTLGTGVPPPRNTPS